MKKLFKSLALIIITVFVATSCEAKSSISEPELSARDFSDFSNVAYKEIAEGLAHEPYGRNQLYGAKEAPAVWWRREQEAPLENEDVIITAALWRDDSPELYIAWVLNDGEKQITSMSKTAILSDNGLQKAKYIANLGKFAQGDKVEYIICASDGDEVKAQLGVFEFTVSKWEPIVNIDAVILTKNGVDLLLNSNSLSPTLSFTLQDNNSLKLDIKPLSPPTKKTQSIIGEIPLGSYTLHINQAPFSFSITDKTNKIVLESGDSGISILTDKANAHKARIDIQAAKQDEFYGLGMRYDSVNQRNKNVDIYCVNWYTEQNGESYAPIPFYFVPDKYGLFVDSTYYSRFEIDTKTKDICRVEVNCRNDDISLYVFKGNNAEILDAYTNITGKPVLPPVWAFGPWISANEWDTQSEILDQLAKSEKHKIPTSVIVIEAWSDEETFYTFNDSRFAASDGAHEPKLSDFTFEGKWPDPKGMVEQIHQGGAKVLLWQIPVLKASAKASAQSSNDKEYAKKQNYLLKDKNGFDYKLPDGTWFGNSFLIDFTSEKASEWFLSKRKYLLSEIGVDGFKTDGGEFVWGRDTASSAGIMGDELRNLYPDLYAQAYFDYARKFVPDALTFSRAGGATMQTHPICWIGDQTSTLKSYEDAIKASLSVSLSGVPFVAWDIAGFSGDVPTSELYQRAVAQAAFSPIMQVHSETSGNPSPSQARTPWNMAQRKGNTDCLDTYRYFANVRMNLLPYIYTQAMHSSQTGEPLMRAMAYQFPQDKDASSFSTQYMLGSDLLVAPVLDLTRGKAQVYLPSGKWYGLFDKKLYEGGTHSLTVPLNEIPVFVRDGAAIPVNLGNSMSLGSYVGSGTEGYENLAVLAFSPEGECKLYDYVNKKNISIKYSDNGRIWEIDARVSSFDSNMKTLIVE